MSETVTTAAPVRPARNIAAPASAQAATPAKAQTLRETKPKTFAPSSLKPLGYGVTEIMTITVPGDWDFADVLKPIAWTSVANQVAANAIKTQIDRIGSLIYVSDAKNRFIANLHISGIVRDHLGNACGVKVMCIGPSIDVKTGKPAPMDLTTGLPWVDPAKPEEKAA